MAIPAIEPDRHQPGQPTNTNMPDLVFEFLTGDISSVMMMPRFQRKLFAKQPAHGQKTCEAVEAEIQSVIVSAQ